MSHRSSSLLTRCALFCAAAAPFALLAGCSNMVSTAPADNVLVSSGGISGMVHGGRQPIVNATVTLWAAGNAGYGSTATALKTTTTDSNGNFSFNPGTGATYTCPASNSPTESQYIYITTSGGQPTPGVANTAAALMVALGNCTTVSNANPYVVVNEVTTVASMFALQQFFTPSVSGLGNFGTSSTNITGLANAMATVNNLVNIGTGTAYATTTQSAAVTGYTTNPVVTITPEQTKINTIANALAACVNTSGTGAPCSTLFSDVNSTAALDTLQAAYYLAVNPTSTVSSTSNILAIYNIAVANSPFNPSLGTVPTDWSIGVTYGSNSTQTVGTTSVYFMTEPEWVAIDSSGNLWTASFSTTSATTPGNSVTELSPIGVPLNQVLTTAGQIAAPKALVLDPNNDVYVASYGASGAGKQITEYSSGGNVYTFSTTVSGPEQLASDGAGNIYIANYSGTAGTGDLEFIAANPTASGATTVISSANTISTGTYSTLAIDSYGDLWLSNNPNTAVLQYICTFSGTPALPTAGGCNSGTSTTAGGSTAPQALSVDHSNNIWVGNYGAAGAGSVGKIAATSTTTITGAIGSAYTGAGLASAYKSMIDGAGNFWTTDYKASAGLVSELSSTGADVSPSAGFVHTYDGAYGIAIDASGNVWVGNSYAAASGSALGYVTEIVGQAAPVITPYAKNLPSTAGGSVTTNTIGTRP